LQVYFSFEQVKHLLYIFLALSGLSALGQTIQVSNAYKLPVKTGKFRVMGKNNDGIIVRLYGQEDVIDVFDENLRLASTRSIDFKNQTGLLQYLMLNKTGALLFYLQQDKRYSVLFAQPVNSKFIEIGKPLAVDTIYDRRDMVASNLRFRQSVDQSSLMIYYPYFNNSNIESVKFICIDRALHQLYNKTIPFNRNEKELEDSKALIDNAGNSFLILKSFESNDGNKYDVFRVDSTGDFSLFSISTNKAIFSEPYFDIDNRNGNLVMSAFYNDDKRAEDVANGFLYSTYNPSTGALIKTGLTPFSKEFITELTSRPPSGDKAKLYTFTIRKEVLRNDGGALIVAESFIKDTRETPVAVGFQQGFGNYRTSYVYQFNDIIAFSIDPKGQLQWHSVMRKKQASEDDNGVYSSFLTMNEKDKLRFLYLDDISTGGILNEYTLSSEGKSERKALLNQEDKEVMLLPKTGKQVAPNEVVIPSYVNGMLRLVRITY
jgi:hypothetical protein